MVAAMVGAPWAGRELHFIGVGGAGMSGLALVANALGARVTGTDRASSSYSERLREAGLNVKVGHHPDRVPPAAEVVVSTAIAADNPELRAAHERGQAVLHRGDLLAQAARLKRSSRWRAHTARRRRRAWPRMRSPPVAATPRS